MSKHHESLNNCLRKYRRLRGLRQKDVADILELKSTGMISRWEKGVCLPETINVIRLTVLYRTMAEALYIDLVRNLKEDLLRKEEKVLKMRDEVHERTKV